MDLTTPQILGLAFGSSGATGTAVQLLALYREKKGWRAEMEARQVAVENRLKQVESESPQALLARLAQIEEFHDNDKRDLLQQMGRIRNALTVTLDAVSRIQERLGITAV